MKAPLVSTDLNTFLFGLTMALLALPFFLVFIAFALDIAAWAFTGHELFPWIGKAMSQ
jgi:hypothetical protein